MTVNKASHVINLLVPGTGLFTPRRGRLSADHLQDHYGQQQPRGRREGGRRRRRVRCSSISTGCGWLARDRTRVPVVLCCCTLRAEPGMRKR